MAVTRMRVSMPGWLAGERDRPAQEFPHWPMCDRSRVPRRASTRTRRNLTPDDDTGAGPLHGTTDLRIPSATGFSPEHARCADLVQHARAGQLSAAPALSSRRRVSLVAGMAAHARDDDLRAMYRASPEGAGSSRSTTRSPRVMDRRISGRANTRRCRSWKYGPYPAPPAPTVNERGLSADQPATRRNPESDRPQRIRRRSANDRHAPGRRTAVAARGA